MKKYVIITGGELFNKGAQAMTFSIVSMVKNVNPNIECVLFSTKDNTQRSDDEKNNYNFMILSYKIREILCSADRKYNPIMKWFHLDEVYKRLINNILENCVMMFDISGYAFSSDWGKRRCQSYLFKILIARKYDIPVYIMPQSFGPLDFHGIDAVTINLFARCVLTYPRIIYAREEQGYQLLCNKFKLENVKKSIDTVFLCDEINPVLIYKVVPSSKNIHIEKNAVGILPNQRTLEHGNEEKILFLYKRIIAELISYQKTVYIISHSIDDLGLCEKLKEKYQDNPQVLHIKQELSCIEYEKTISKFQYLIASRYHSIVHAYKQGVPCVVLGWAVKYSELTNVFGQGKYLFDISRDFSVENILSSLKELNSNFTSEHLILEEKLKSNTETSSFEFIYQLKNLTL